MTEDTRKELRAECEVILALERVPAVIVPTDFAARCAALVPKERRAVAHATRARVSVGQSVALLCFVGLLAAMVWLAPQTHVDNPISVAAMYTICAEMVGIVVWLTAAGRRTD